MTCLQSTDHLPLIIESNCSPQLSMRQPGSQLKPNTDVFNAPCQDIITGVQPVDALERF